MSNTVDDKFSRVEEDTTMEWYTEMQRYIHYVAHQNPGLNVEYEDIIQELMLELVKGVQRYKDLPHNELKAILKRMFDNRISELKYRYHVTHRKQELFNISLDIEVSIHTDPNKPSMGIPREEPGPDSVPFSEVIPDSGSDPADIYASKERVLDVRKKLSPVAKQVFDSLIRGNNMLAMIIWLSSIRSGYVFGSRAVRVRPWHIADALGLDEKEVKVALREIKKRCREYYDD